MKQTSAALMKKLRTLYWAEVHMDETKQVCALIRSLKNPSKRLLFGLQSGAILSYCRSFGANQGISALPAELSQFDNPDHKKLHEHLLNVRNLMFAHKDFLREGELLPAVDKNKLPQITITVAADGSTEWNVKRSTIGPDLIRRIEVLAQFQRQRLNEASSKLLADACRGKAYDAKTYILGSDFP
jgi:hypothetical protein